MIRTSAPGKLYVAGEYAVVEPGHRAVLAAVDRLLTVTLAPAEGTGRIRSAAYAGGLRVWGRSGPDAPARAEDGRVDYIISAIRHVEALVRESGGRLRLFDLLVHSGLTRADGRKLGLGSSSAVTVATVRAVARFYDLALDDLAVYKLAMVASDAVEPIGSGGDLAAAAFTGWVSYSSPDRAWMRRAKESGLGGLVHSPWPALSVRRLPVAAQVDLRVGWTGRPASTASLVAGVQSAASGAGDPRDYAGFLRASQHCVQALERALESGDARTLRHEVGVSRSLLKDLGRRSGVVIETPLLSRLVDIARDHGAAAKSSGAGGGDCGIALCPPGTAVEAMQSAWASAGIEPLDLPVHSRPQEDA